MNAILATVPVLLALVAIAASQAKVVAVVAAGFVALGSHVFGYDPMPVVNAILPY